MITTHQLFLGGIIAILGVNVCQCVLDGLSSDCPIDRHRCDFGSKCIGMDAVCDGFADCKDGTDEFDCDFKKCRSPKWYLCDGNSTCISHNFRCDGHFDCPHNDDEEGCIDYVPHHEQIECSDKEFTCSGDSLCLPMELVCDGINHCMDGSDEKIGCMDLSKSCKGYLCRNKHCLSDRSWVCDGHNDCGDNSDEEEHCVNNCLLENSKFLCHNNETCIPVEKVCDGSFDCADNSDEGVQCSTFKSSNSCETFGCPSDAKCQILPTHVTCLCPSGYRYNSQTRKCDDINECLTYGICSHGCINSDGSYKCVCAPKFKLLEDNRTCEVIGKDDPLLLYAGDKAVYGLTLKTRHMYPVVNNLHQVIGISYDGEYVYWTEISLHMESVMRSKVDGTEQEILLTSGLAAPEGIAVDYFTKNIYLTDNGFMHIAVCSNDGRHCTALVTENVHKPRGIALHSHKGMMYWSDWGSNPMIAVASMDGKLSRPFITDDIHWPNGLTLDWPNERLYWVDAKLQTIQSVDFEGKNRRSVIKNVSKHPYGIAIFQDTLYWSDWNSKSIQSCDKFTGKHRKTIVKDSKIYDVHIYDSVLESVGVNSCLKNLCSHLCLLSMNNTYSCACPKYMELNDDQHTCKVSHKQHILLLGIGKRFIRFEHQSFGRHNDGKGDTVNFNIHKIAYNSITNDAIVADNTAKVIFGYNLDSRIEKKLVSENIGLVSALAFDDLANNLYWADSERSTVEVFSFNTQHRAVLHHFVGTETPIGLAVVPNVGKMFIALRSSVQHTHIDMMKSDGQGKHFHVLEDDIGNGRIHMVPDFGLREVFWADYEKRRIAYVDYGGAINQVFLAGISKPASMAILGDDIFWTSSKSLRLNWTPKHNIAGTKSLTVEQPEDSPLPETIELATVTPITVSKHPCMATDNGGCSHICIALSETSHSCLCPVGMVFKDSANMECIVDKECEFRCGSGECISATKRCDGFNNCIDHSDEDDCGAHKRYFDCAPDEFACADGSKCVSRALRCNENFDCVDKSDELDCKNYNRTTQCHHLQHVCPNGKCVDVSNVCDGYADCSDGSDEKNCKATGTNCPPNMVMCASGSQCIMQRWLCDGQEDCEDKSDERNCPAKVECPAGSGQCAHGGCVDKQLWCDGNNDCGDFSDESDCRQPLDVKIACGSDDINEDDVYQCTSNPRICLHNSARCNGTAECPRGEDEVNCPGCSPNEFKCTNFKCINMDFLCDGQKDCVDGSDEQNCHNSSISTGGGIFNRKCHPDIEFDCQDGTCINWDRVCDQKNDCANGKDEDGVCKTSCANGHPCEQRCLRSPSGPVCACRDGYELNGDKKTCSDIDECTNGDNPCAQICSNTDGSYECSCHSDFHLRSDKTSCKSIYAPKQLLYSSYGMILRLHSNLDVVWSTNSSAKINGMDLNYAQQLLYFTVEDQSSLYELNLTSNRLSTVDNVGTPTKIAVDWITNNVYFIDYNSEGPEIRVCHMLERRCIRLLKFRSDEHVKSITIDPINRRLFYVVVKYLRMSSPETRIFIDSLDGTQKRVLVDSVHDMMAMSVDPYSERVYFTDMDKRSLLSIRYDGTKKQTLIENNAMLVRPSVINLLEGHAYIMNIGSKIIADCTLYGLKGCKEIKVNVESPNHLIVAQQSRQPETSSNMCASKNCSTICVPGDTGAKCLCSLGAVVEPHEECRETNEVGASFRNTPEISEPEVGGSVGGIIGTILVLLVIIVVVMGGFFVYKRKFAPGECNVSMHFQNPKNAFDAAKLRICQMPQMVRDSSSRLNEIFVNGRQDASKVPATIEETDETEMFHDDHTRHLLPPP